MSSSDALKKLIPHLERCARDPVYFADRFLGFEAFEYQAGFLRDSSPNIACVCGRQVGKTTLVAIKALHYAFFNPEKTVIIVSASLRQSIILFDMIRDHILRSPLIRLKTTEMTRTKIAFDHGSRIIALPCGRTGFSLRGYSVDMAVLDEANFMSPVVIENVVMPMLVARPDPRMLMASTPWTKDHPFYRARYPIPPQATACINGRPE